MTAPKRPEDIVPMSAAVGIPEGRGSADPEEHRARKWRALVGERDQAIADRDVAAARLAAVEAEREEAKAIALGAISERDDFESERDRLAREHASLNRAVDHLEDRGVKRERALMALEAEVPLLRAALAEVRRDLEAIREHAQLDVKERGFGEATRYVALADHALAELSTPTNEEPRA